MKKTFVGFGFGAIQSGLFLYEAFESGNFDRLVVVEVIPEVVESVRRDGSYMLNVATETGVVQRKVNGVEIYNPTVKEDCVAIVAALAEAKEVATALPSVAFFDRGEASVAALMREGFLQKIKDTDLPKAVVYAGENHNHAAEVLAEKVGLGEQGTVQFLNTVIGKMSGVVVDAEQIKRDGLALMGPGLDRAFLVEEFNNILISRIDLEGFERGIDVLTEKDDLLPFEEAKLYGHNATHALLGYLANEKGCAYMSDVPDYLIRFAADAFFNESGRALISKYAGVDALFTKEGFKLYVDDLMKRMMNPYLRDQVERVIRDPLRKLSENDRLIGTMRLCISEGLFPSKFARGVRAGLEYLWNEDKEWDNRYPWDKKAFAAEVDEQIRWLI